jgi:hypothetical protein
VRSKMMQDPLMLSAATLQTREDEDASKVAYPNI